MWTRCHDKTPVWGRNERANWAQAQLKEQINECVLGGINAQTKPNHKDKMQIR